MRSLVTGGGGFLGLYIVEQLVARGDDVRVLCRGHYRQVDDLGVETVRTDIRDHASVREACAQTDCVFHCAAVPGVWGPWKMYHDINTLGTQNVIDGCRQQGVSRLVYTSSPSVVFDGRDHENADELLSYPDRYLCHYPHSKALAEQAVLAANGKDLATISLRPHLIWGPRDNHLIPRLIERAGSGRLRRVGDGTNLVSNAYVENVAAAHLQAADVLQPEAPCAGRAYFVNEPQPVRLWDWIDRLLDSAGFAPVTKAVPAAAAYRIGAVLEGMWSLLRLSGEPPMTRFLALQLSGSHYYCAERARIDFGYKTVVDVDEAMRRTVPELRQRGQGNPPK